eukprot:SAG31_NODE_42834_length_269_cov_9.458824_1_plen_43_part_10
MRIYVAATAHAYAAAWQRRALRSIAPRGPLGGCLLNLVKNLCS